MTKTFKSERERLEKEIEKSKKENITILRNIEADLLKAKLTQLNECEEICREEIDKMDYTEQYDKENKYSKKDEAGFFNEVIDKNELKQNLFGGEEKC